MNAVAQTNPAALVEKVVIQGDLSKLSPQERLSYYNMVCESAGLNPLTRPFDYLQLNGRLVLYALKACTDQLRMVHKISVESLENRTVEGVYIVTAKVRNAEGRTDVDDGAVEVGNLKGEKLANAMMKASTKAKRRATLSICGLGLLDETEVETIPGAVKGEPIPAPDPPKAPKSSKRDWTTRRISDIETIASWDMMADFENTFGADLEKLATSDAELHAEVMDAMRQKQQELG